MNGDLIILLMMMSWDEARAQGHGQRWSSSFSSSPSWKGSCQDLVEICSAVQQDLLLKPGPIETPSQMTNTGRCRG